MRILQVTFFCMISSRLKILRTVSDTKRQQIYRDPEQPGMVLSLFDMKRQNFGMIYQIALEQLPALANLSR